MGILPWLVRLGACPRSVLLGAPWAADAAHVSRPGLRARFRRTMQNDAELIGLEKID
jgi:hypothetical protein